MVRGGHDIAQCSSEATEYDDRNLYGRNAARDSAQEGATALTERNEEEEDGGSCGPREDDGDDEYMDVGDENMQDQNMHGDDDVGVTSEHGPGDIPTGSVGAAVGRPLSSPAIWHSQGGSQGGHDSQEQGGSKSRKRTRKTSPSASAHKRQARTDAVNEARGALVASQEARPPRKSSQEGRSGGRGGDRGGARKGIVNAIESFITTEPGAWDRPDLVLAPVDRTDIVGGQGRRITPTEFLERDSSEFDWYAVCGQHTVEAMKTLVKKGSPAIDVYGLRAYSKVWVVYFGDEQTRGYFNVSAFDNTRENRAMMLSFEDVVRDMRQWWIDNHRIEAPKGKVSDKDAVAVAHQKKWQNFLRASMGDKDAVAVAHQKKWQNFLRASMGKACDKAFVKQALENEYSKDWSNKLRGYMNLATSTEAVWPLVEKFFEMFNEGKLPVGNGKIPLDMPGRMEGRQPGPYTDKTKGQRTLYHCIYTRDGPKGSTVSWKDLCPSYFKNFGDWTCREREVALLLLMQGKVVTTNIKVMPPRVNTECLLDIMRKERYMVRMFNYVVFRAEGRADDEWNVAFFMSYKDLEDRYGPNGLCAAEWEKERDKLHVNKVKTVPRRLGGVEEARQGSGLGPTATMYKEAPFHFKVFVYTSIDKLDLLRAEVKRVASSARHIVAVILDISPANFCTTWTSQEFDALHSMMTKCCDVNWVFLAFAPQKVQSDVLRCLFQWEDIELILGTWKRVDRPSNDITRKILRTPTSNWARTHVLRFRAEEWCKLMMTEGSIPVAVPSVASMVAPSETAVLQDIGRCRGNEEDDIEIPGEASTLAPSDAIPPGYCADPNTIYFLEGKHTHTSEDQWGHDIIWHEGVLQPCIQDGEWKMAVKYTSGGKTFRRMSKDIWLKTTELAILHRVRVENPGQSEAAIKAKAEELFHVLRDNR
ncbi:hypothetical protein CBR_g55232 [Chara braunii]|uniref:Uncharacterized protein n=1 Tax=Chara braunii TaxID=69332 RepID=A0A388MCR2_CHABU|nr:hypothetical protein CBR_g55232 [Chara braunii]|eukprot:GBG92351.1 hypothetical protein CBR_g55232 [Chara braunii]